MLHCNLSEAYAVDEYERIVAEYASAHPDEAWIVGGGWSMDVFPGGNPPKEVLDAVVRDRPVYLMSRDGHSAWANSRAFEIAGLTRETPDPVDGWIVRDDAREPAGTVHEGAFLLIERHVPDPTLSDWVEGLRAAQRHLHSLGITAWQDAHVGGQLPDVRRVRAARRIGRAHRPRGRRAVVGPPPGDRTGERPARGARAGSDRAVRGHDRQDHAGRRGRESSRPPSSSRTWTPMAGRRGTAERRSSRPRI